MAKPKKGNPFPKAKKINPGPATGILSGNDKPRVMPAQAPPLQIDHPRKQVAARLNNNMNAAMKGRK